MSASTVFLDVGGPDFVIAVDGKFFTFELHPYCGPTLLNTKGIPLNAQPSKFLEAASLWCQQGKKVQSGLCVWHRPPKPILKHLGGRNWEIIGYEPPLKGE